MSRPTILPPGVTICGWCSEYERERDLARQHATDLQKRLDKIIRYASRLITVLDRKPGERISYPQRTRALREIRLLAQGVRGANYEATREHHAAMAKRWEQA